MQPMRPHGAPRLDSYSVSANEASPPPPAKILYPYCSCGFMMYYGTDTRYHLPSVKTVLFAS